MQEPKTPTQTHEENHGHGTLPADAVQDFDERLSLRKGSVIVVIVNVLITAGTFNPIWVLLRRRELNQLAGRPIGWLGPVLAAIVYAGTLLWAVLEEPLKPTASSTTGALKTIDFVGMVLIILVMLSVRNKLVGHYRIRLARHLKISRIWTILLGAIYLQHRINQLRDTVSAA